MAEFEETMESVADVMEKLMDAAEEIEKFIAQGPPWFRKKQNRERAQSIEQEYHTAIKFHEHAIPFRRAYKPP